MKTLSEWNKGDARTRKIVETVFSQLEDQLLMKRYYFQDHSCDITHV
jgi:hypothetical protein